jgi:RepB DNA-primase from phage plasmid
MSLKHSMPEDKDTAAQYIRDNFKPGDRLAVVLLNKRSEDVIQRLAAAERIARDDFQAWLRFQNAHGYEVYVSMNALAPTARGRTKADVQTIRHLYLDFDRDGTAAVEKLLAREDLPKPNYLLNTSPDKWQAVWKVQAFNKDQAEHLQQAFAREMDADPAATDCARVLRVPGFYNHKSSQPFRVTVQAHSTETYSPNRFPQFPDGARISRTVTSEQGLSRTPRTAPPSASQSKRDWAFAKRALARGEREESVIAAIAAYRRYEKHNPQYYAELTVRKVARSLGAGNSPAQTRGAGPDR